MKHRPTVLSIAGFDPSGGAGLLADIKTFEAIKVYGLGICSALTWQNESEFEKVEWLTAEKIISQAEILLRKSKINFVKIGLVENAETLQQLVLFFKNYDPGIKIIWDPVLKASAGFDFHSASGSEKWKNCLKDLFIITPNWTESIWLAGKNDGIESAKELAGFCHVYLKGGHNPLKPGYDYIFQLNASPLSGFFSFRPKAKNPPSKHGSGCVLASALTAYLAKGFPIKKAGLMAKNYVTEFLLSNPSLLGYHNN